MPYPQFDRKQLLVKRLSERAHDMALADVLPLDAEIAPLGNPDLATVAVRMRAATVARSGFPSGAISASSGSTSASAMSCARSDRRLTSSCLRSNCGYGILDLPPQQSNQSLILLK